MGNFRISTFSLSHFHIFKFANWRMLIFLLIGFSLSASAQRLPSLEERVSAMKKMPGFFNVYWDDTNGRVYLEIDKWEKEILYTVSLPAGLGSNDVGLDRGLNNGGNIVKFTQGGEEGDDG